MNARLTENGQKEKYAFKYVHIHRNIQKGLFHFDHKEKKEKLGVQLHRNGLIDFLKNGFPSNKGVQADTG